MGCLKFVTSNIIKVCSFRFIHLSGYPEVVRVKKEEKSDS